MSPHLFGIDAQTHLDKYSHIHFIHELSRFRFVPRGWTEDIGIPPGYAANNAEHSFNTITIGVLIGAMENLPETDIHAIAFGLWLHDTPELRTRDHTPSSKKYVKVFEKRAFRDIFARTPPTLKRMAHKAFGFYKKRERLIDRIIKSADIIDSARECIEWKTKGFPYLDHIPDRIAEKRAILVELGVPSALIIFDDLLETGHAFIWLHKLAAPNTFSDKSYGR